MDQNTSERGSREWGTLNPMQDDKVSMFGTPQKPGLRPGLRDLMRMKEPKKTGRREMHSDPHEDAYM
jgi:hypothetical protein